MIGEYCIFMHECVKYMILQTTFHKDMEILITRQIEQNKVCKAYLHKK